MQQFLAQNMPTSSPRIISTNSRLATGNATSSRRTMLELLGLAALFAIGIGLAAARLAMVMGRMN